MFLMVTPTPTRAAAAAAAALARRQGGVMRDAVQEFFDRLGRGQHEPNLVRFTGTIRFDLGHDRQVDHWLLAVSDGEVRVSREEGQADMVVAADRATFNQILFAGGSEIFAAYIRHKLKITGNPRMLFVLRVLADPRPH